MATWSWSIGPWKPGASTKTSLGGGPVADIGSASARSLKLRLLDPSDATFTVLGTSDEAQLLEELITDVWVYRDGVSLFRGRVTKTTDTLNASGLHTVAVEAHDYRSVLDRRIAYTDRTWTSAGQAQTVWDALTDTQLLAGGSLGLTQGVWPGTDVVRPSVIIKAGDTVYSFIKKLGQMQGGFDFDIDDSLRANLWSPRRGVDNGATLDLGGAVIEMGRTFDTAQYADALRQSGADSVTPTTLTTADISSAPQGRWDAQFGDTQLTTADMVAQTAQTNLNQAALVVPVYSLVLRAGGWGGPSHVFLGDYGTVAVRSGRLDEQAAARVYEVDVEVDASDVEKVTVVAGDIRLDPKSVLRGIAKRVQQLSKR
jgi:hypothetical protein